MPLPSVIVEGRLVDDPELRFTPSGIAVANFRIAANSRTKNEATGQWENKDSCFLNCSVWREMAENAVESLRKGDEAAVWGDLRTVEYERQDGGKAVSFELLVRVIGPSLRFRRTPHSKDVERAQPRVVDDPWSQGEA